MKKIVIALLVSASFTPAFAATKMTHQSTQKIYPMDSFDPSKFSVSDIPEFTRRYFSETQIFLKKGEFETTPEYKKRIAQDFKLKSLDSNKIYAFELDSINVTYNADEQQYEVSTRGDVGKIVEENSKSQYLRVGEIYRKSGSYIGSNAYGLQVKIKEIKGSDFYIKTSSNLKNYEKNNYIKSKLTFPVAIEQAKKYSTCSKKLYVFAKLNESTPELNSSVGIVVNSPTRDLPFDISIHTEVIPMDVKGMILQCSNGQVIRTMYSENPPVEEAEKETASTMDPWKLKVLNKAILYWKKPESLNGMIDSQIQVTVDNKGHLRNLHWIKPTGVRNIDRSIVNAFKNAAPFDPPPSISSEPVKFIVTFPAMQQLPINQGTVANSH